MDLNSEEFFIVLISFAAVWGVYALVGKIPIWQRHWQALQKVCVFILVWFGIAIAWALARGGFLWAYPQEDENSTVKWQDCRKIRYYDSRPAPDFLKTYSCTFYRSTQDGHIMSGQCVHVKLPMFGSGCEEARVYSVTERPLKKAKD